MSVFLAAGATTSGNRAFLHSTLTGFYRYAIGRGLATRSPVRAEAPKVSVAAPPYIYSRDELRRLLDAVRTYRQRINQLEPHTLRSFILILYGAGLRRQEALNLTMADVNLRGALLTVRKTKFDKTRLVPLGPHLARVMKDYAARRKASNASQADEAPFFVNRDGSPLAAAAYLYSTNMYLTFDLPADTLRNYVSAEPDPPPSHVARRRCTPSGADGCGKLQEPFGSRSPGMRGIWISRCLRGCSAGRLHESAS